jgi:hypothetical protein
MVYCSPQTAEIIAETSQAGRMEMPLWRTEKPFKGASFETEKGLNKPG